MPHAPRLCAARPLLVLSLALTGCGSSVILAADAHGLDASSDALSVATDVPGDVPTGPPTALWRLPRTSTLDSLALPWPNDLALATDGTVDFRYVPGAAASALLRGYITALAGRIHGFSTVGAVYFRFSTGLDPTTLPASATATLDAGASVQLVDIDPASPDHGHRVPTSFYFRPAHTHYWPDATLAVSPMPGWPLRPSTRYAAVVTRALHSASGGPFLRDADLASVLAGTGDASTQAAHAGYASALSELTAAGVATDAIVSMTTFTTQDPVGDFFHAVHALQTSAPEPDVIDLSGADPTPHYAIYTGHYGPDPIYQSGAAPYNDAGSGDFVFGPDGDPEMQTTERITFALTVPLGTMPAGGWPVVVYAHGTDGNARSFITDGTANAMALQGLAVFGFDQIFNGDRSVGGTGLAEEEFFNFTNPLAVRTNNRQAGLDLVQVGRLIPRLRVPAAMSSTHADITFDASRISFFGHSQGGLNGPLWLAAEDTARAGVLSGAAGTLTIALTEKTEPVNIPQLLATLLGLPSSDTSELVPSHPLLTMFQTAVDAADPINYARYIVREPRAANHPHDVFQTQGFVDHYAPDDAIASLAIAIGDQLVAPVLHPVDTYGLTGLTIGTLPLHGNVAGGAATAVWQQFDAPARDDGHFVVFDVPAARDRAARFLASSAADRTVAATVTP